MRNLYETAAFRLKALGDRTMSPAGTVYVKVTYLAELNWSLMRAGIPLIQELTITSDCPNGSTNLHVSLAVSIPKYLDSPYETSVHADGNDVSYNLRGAFANLNWAAGWKIAAATPSQMYLTVGRARLQCPVEIQPTNWWHRVIDTLPETDSRSGRQLAVRTVQATVRGSDCTTTVPELHYMIWTNQQPLQAAITALIDPNYSGNDRLYKATLNNILDAKGLPRRSLLQDASPQEALRALYVSIANKNKLRHSDNVETFRPHLQAVRMSDEDRNRWTLCLDLVCQGCEVLERLGLHPVFLLVNSGEHALLGVTEFSRCEAVMCGTAVYDHMNAIQLLDITYALEGRPFDEVTSPILTLSELGVSDVCHLVDVKACRETLNIQPMPGRPVGKLRNEPQLWPVIVFVCAACLGMIAVIVFVLQHWASK